ncbi:peptide chain release factor N(5)-glutamine methyltransferase [Butyrivibrio fibrisolvens]|jgi:release factor glutamine methyltransferase|uniref:Release factor glutamine methyltransferase n=1 Tax=Butyrivibrio fibrisolvens TaxID=831 RepID=A0A1H9PHT6_BUTFI|nr:peptide chain release factor N(5)-glutamine methyltransferase [Butyrivibrio fibrisolvens]PWT27444.1 protein-(glutamine-N5) methyltransferase, release factor-specific [Butyrivibrio fibrisolvens]SER47419.1 release factor glutamine methyltransferase [Butyrivibrio fibrisolvens]
MIYSDIYKNASIRLKEAGVPEYQLDARLLLEYVCGTDYNTLLVHGDRDVSPEEEKKYNELIEKRASRVPLAYIVGYQEFMGLTFDVNENVLVPNQDTETLAEEALRELSDGMRFMDLCTGSGCVALSILNYTNDTSCVMTDISDKAIEVATGNRDRLGFSDRAEIVKTDLFPQDDDKKFDMIVSNPPYIRTDVIATLPPEVGKGEPYIALDGGQDGLIFYRRIIENAPKWLYTSGWLMMEIGYDQGDAVAGLMKDGGFHEVEVIKDLGGNDRVVRGCLY